MAGDAYSFLGQMLMSMMGQRPSGITAGGASDPYHAQMTGWATSGGDIGGLQGITQGLDQYRKAKEQAERERLATPTAPPTFTEGQYDYFPSANQIAPGEDVGKYLDPSFENYFGGGG